MADALPRILLVEDEPMIAFALEDMVMELGYGVIGPAFRLSEALSLQPESSSRRRCSTSI
jgi:DNA-binding response OmpR family regulator